MHIRCDLFKVARSWSQRVQGPGHVICYRSIPGKRGTVTHDQDAIEHWDTHRPFTNRWESKFDLYAEERCKWLFKEICQITALSVRGFRDPAFCSLIPE